MDNIQLLEILDNGEDTKHQFKVNFGSIDKLAAEIGAFANTHGGMLIVGASDIGEIIGLSQEDISRLNQWISNATSQKIDPPIFVKTEILTCHEKRLLVIHVPLGTNKPYAVNRTEFWVKNGADKRRATREELQRLMQASNILFADELETDAHIDHFDFEFFEKFYKLNFKEELSEIDIPRKKLLENLKLLRNNRLTLAGLLLFGKKPDEMRPQFSVKATYFDGNKVSVNYYRDMEDITGKLIEKFKAGIYFIKRNLHRIQKGDNFNVPSTLEIPEPAFTEALSNAIIHRDYFISSQIFINLFHDRLEIVSPGTLPNTLTEENIKFGAHVERNPTILTFLEKDKEFRYSGRGSGVPRIINSCKQEDVSVEFVNDEDTKRFKVIFYRPKKD